MDDDQFSYITKLKKRKRKKALAHGRHIAKIKEPRMRRQ
jgi:hypothetical protein